MQIAQIKSWDQARQLARQLNRYAFRGHGDQSWEMRSSLERLAKHFDYDGDLKAREYWILRQFQRRAHMYVESPPRHDSSLEWLALLQHYGGPTRLVDFTHSFYVAAFFAVEAASSDAAVWSVNLTDLENRLGTWSGNIGTMDHLNRKHIDIVEEILNEKESKNGVVNVEPDRINERMSIQQGLFLFPKNIEASFMNNLLSTLNDTSVIDETNLDVERACKEPGMIGPIVKIILPRSIHEDAIEDLRDMNLTAETLFPGLEGFARSMQVHLRSNELYEN